MQTPTVKYSVKAAVRVVPLDRVGPGGSTELTTVVGASAGEGCWYLFRYGGTIYEFLLLISQEECDETRT